MVQDAIENGGGDHPIAEHLAPSAKALVAGEDHRSFLVATADQLKEQVRTEPVDWQISDLTDDQESWDRVHLQLLFKPPLVQRSREDSDHRRRRGEKDPVAMLGRLQPQSHA